MSKVYTPVGFVFIFLFLSNLCLVPVYVGYGLVAIIGKNELWLSGWRKLMTRWVLPSVLVCSILWAADSIFESAIDVSPNRYVRTNFEEGMTQQQVHDLLLKWERVEIEPLTETAPRFGADAVYEEFVFIRPGLLMEYSYAFYYDKDMKLVDYAIGYD